MILLRVLLIFLFLISSAHSVEVLEVVGEVVKFRTTEHEIPTGSKVSIYSKKNKKGKRKKLAIAKVIGKLGKIYSAKILKKRKTTKITDGQYVRISKKYRIGSGGKTAKKGKGNKKSKSANGAHSFLARLRPLGMVTGYYDVEAEFALKGSNRSFGLSLALLNFENSNKTVAGFGGIGKYKIYFSPRAISKGLYVSALFGFYRLSVEGESDIGDTLSVYVYGPYLGSVLGYQYFINDKWSVSVAAGGGLFVLPSEIETTNSTGQTSTIEIPLSGFAPNIDINIGYSF